jgi:alkylation response protein AidB-like acyl-CoA dehydrogenase
MAEQTLDRIVEVAPLIASEAATSEATGRLTDVVVKAMREAGVFRMTMSRDLGGPDRKSVV